MYINKYNLSFIVLNKIQKRGISYFIYSDYILLKQKKIWLN